MTTEATLCKQDRVTTPAECVRQGRAYVPNVDIVENNREVLLMADVPGVKAENLSIDYERGVLTVRGGVTLRQDPKETRYLLREYGMGDFERTFRIGEAVDAGKIEAKLRDGVLTLRLPKREEILPRKIAIKTN